MNCYYCGSKLDDDNFCKRCGKEAKEIIIDYDKLNFEKEKQEKNGSEVSDNTKEDHDIPKDTEKAPVEDINEKPESAIVESQENDAVDSDKAALPKSKKPIKVVVRARKTKKI